MLEKKEYALKSIIQGFEYGGLDCSDLMPREVEQAWSPTSDLLHSGVYLDELKTSTYKTRTQST